MGVAAWRARVEHACACVLGPDDFFHLRPENLLSGDVFVCGGALLSAAMRLDPYRRRWGRRALREYLPRVKIGAGQPTQHRLRSSILDATAAKNGYSKHELLREAGIPSLLLRPHASMAFKADIGFTRAGPVWIAMTIGSFLWWRYLVSDQFVGPDPLVLTCRAC